MSSAETVAPDGSAASQSPLRYVLTLRCPDRPGIVRALSEGIVQAGGNIVENAQFSDGATGLFCVRTAFDSPVTDLATVHTRVGVPLKPFDPVLTLRPLARRRRALVMVSRVDHCLRDLLYRWQIGELPVEIPLVVSNHPDLRQLVESHHLPFVHLPVTPATKLDAEARLLELIREHAVDFVVLARYMQILSRGLCDVLAGRVINIHHSLLPGFKGARPYHQAHDRGVKLIGATAHFVTADLDGGPIIEQGVVSVGHAHEAEEFVAIGRDVERVVLARAVRLHAEDRVLLVAGRTVVFS